MRHRIKAKKNTRIVKDRACTVTVEFGENKTAKKVFTPSVIRKVTVYPDPWIAKQQGKTFEQMAEETALVMLKDMQHADFDLSDSVSDIAIPVDEV